MLNRGSLSIIATSLMLIASAPLFRAQEATQAPGKTEAREAWRKVMVKTPLPRNGCFKAEYPRESHFVVDGVVPADRGGLVSQRRERVFARHGIGVGPLHRAPMCQQHL